MIIVAPLLKVEFFVLMYSISGRNEHSLRKKINQYPLSEIKPGKVLATCSRKVF
jgi:hypothetical protein